MSAVNDRTGAATALLELLLLSLKELAAAGRTELLVSWPARLALFCASMTQRAGRDSMRCCIGSPKDQLQEPRSASKTAQIRWRMTMSDTDGAKAPAHGIFFMESAGGYRWMENGDEEHQPSCFGLEEEKSEPWSGSGATRPLLVETRLTL
jgi:hypothetical protein